MSPRFLALVPLIALACRDLPPPPTKPALPLTLVDVTEESGVDFRHNNGRSERRYLPETMGSGAACFDADGDRLPDLFFVNGLEIEALANPAGQPGPRLFRNLGNWRFQDVTATSGLSTPFYGMGAAAGDVDNDGDLDLVVAGVGGDRLFLNQGQTFSDGSAAWGLDQERAGFSSSALFFDADADGFLDLLIGRYVTWSATGDLRCSPDGKNRSYCTPEAYRGAANLFWRNQGGRRFVAATRDAGLEELAGKTLGLVATDLNRDGAPDLVVANDTQRNFLFRNDGRGRFRESGLEAGIALSASGVPRGAMGIDSGDFDGDGRDDLVIGNFAQEMATLALQTESGLFLDEAAPRGIGFPTLLTLAFGTLAVDLDQDGWLDLVFANGHIEPEIARLQPSQSYAQPLQIFRNRNGRDFEQLSDFGIRENFVGRGLLACDLDQDGDQDLVLTQNGGPAKLLRNDAAPASWIEIELIGTKSARTPYGAVVELAVEGADGTKRQLRRTLMSGRSYLVAMPPLLNFGLGDARKVEKLTIKWPLGHEQEVAVPAVNQRLVITEGAP